MRAREFIYTYDDIYYITENMKPMFVESLTSRFSNIIWKQNGQQFVGIGTFDKHSNQQFFINFTVFPYTFLNKKYRTVYIEFTRVIDGISTVELLDLNAADSNYIDPARVFGAIFNSILNKIKELNALYGIDAVVCTVDKNEIKPLHCYQGLEAPKIVKKTKLPRRDLSPFRD